MKLLYIAQGFGRGFGVSGGDIRFIEIAKRLPDNPKIYVLTTLAGKMMCLCHGLTRANYVVSRTQLFSRRERFERTKTERVLSYIISLIYSSVIILKTALRRRAKEPLFDIAYSTSDFPVDVLPAVFLKYLKICRKNVVFIHHEYQLTIKRKPLILSIFATLVQRLMHYVIARHFDSVFVYATCEGGRIAAKFKKYNKRAKIFYMKNGIEYQNIMEVLDEKINKEYDLCLVAALRESKGIFDFINVLDKLDKLCSNHIKACIIGTGSKEVLHRIQDELVRRDLCKSVELKGFIPHGHDLYRAMRQCRILVHPSYEEGWCITILEALCLGLIVIAYDLPAYKPIYENQIVIVPRGDTNQLAQVILRFLRKRNHFSNKRAIIANFAKFDWKNIAKEEYTALKNILYN